MLSAVTVFLVRVGASWGRTEYSIWPDEPAQLAMARFLGGGTSWTMHDHSTWRPAYAALLAPIHWFTSDPAIVFRLALVVNAVLGAVAALLLVVLARRLTSLGPWGCAAIAVIVSLTPARLFTTDFVWSESLTAAMFLVALLALLRFWSAPSRSSGVLLGFAAAAAVGAHSRLLPLVVIALVVMALAVRRRSLSAVDATIAAACTVGGLIAVEIATRLIVAQLWRNPTSNNSAGAVADRLTDPGALLLSFAGQTWYQLVASAGLIGVGGWVLARNSFASGSDRSTTRVPTRDDARLVGLTVAACAGLSIAFMAGRLRADQVVYGRYSDVVTAPVLLIGLATLVTAATATTARSRVVAAVGIAAATIATAAVTVISRHDALASSNGLEPMILGLQPFRGSSDRIDVFRITVLALAVGAVLLATTFLRSRALLAGTIAAFALVVVGDAFTADILDREWSGRGGHDAVAELADGPLASGAPVDFLVPAASNSTNRLMLYQMYLPESEFTVVEDSSEVASSPLVFAPPGDTALDEAGALLLWTDRFGRMSLWDRSVVR
ncbi:hypothetical protein [Ilumatobacter nonamiensis]|uniref:hypothetical protein n=1 Tax=Ilumatobacter nonamiensis TaxID=467093 RepID=UPI000590C9F8|nr:hypothetical protein [Ilumatobacter nonamiensis]